jgi:hypothetical protein
MQYIAIIKYYDVLCNVVSNEANDMTTITMTIKMTIRQIRAELFTTGQYAVIGADEMTGKEARDFLFNKENQDEIFNVQNQGTHLLIWN